MWLQITYLIFFSFQNVPGECRILLIYYDLKTPCDVMDPDQHWFRLWLVACWHQVITKTLAYVSWDIQEHISVKFYPKWNHFHARKCTLKCRVNDGYLVYICSVYSLLMCFRFRDAPIKTWSVLPSAHFYQNGLTLILVWIGNSVNYKAWNEITKLLIHFQISTV